jgi:hypothetical protein
MAYNSERVKRGCPIGQCIVDGIGDSDNGNLPSMVTVLEASVNSIGTDVSTNKTSITTLIEKTTALETALSAVLAATAEDNGKTLKIDSTGKVALVTV